jgi:hypothetical protein
VNNLEGVTLLLADQVAENSTVCPNPALRILTPLTDSRATTGDTVTFIGTATHADTNRFHLAVRPINVEAEWTLVNELRRDVSFGRLGVWDTTENRAATYEVRLTAVNRDNIILTNAPVCTIEIELTN